MSRTDRNNLLWIVAVVMFGAVGNAVLRAFGI